MEEHWSPPRRRRRNTSESGAAIALGLFLGGLFILTLTSTMRPKPVAAAASEMAQCPSSFWECEIQVAPGGPVSRGERFHSKRTACTPGQALFRAEREAVKECIESIDGQERDGCFMEEFAQVMKQLSSDLPELLVSPSPPRSEERPRSKQ